ncbi:MAG: hypothetical protein J6M18_01470 [Actinomycetaceae bacterium]|nr:hypothetical protein [Actinomycetaceae bacterium]
MSTHIQNAVEEIEKYVASYGWDGPIRLFALIRSAKALENNPELVDQLPPDVSLEAAQSSESIFSVEQEDLPRADSVEELLSLIQWPENVDGAAITCERITLPPDAETEIPDNPIEAEKFLANDPRREDVRMAVGVMRNGESWCSLRLKSHDRDSEVLGSADLIPELVRALEMTFQ